MPSLILRANGIWYGVFSHKGKRVWRSTLTKSKDEAASAYTMLCREFVSWKRLTLEGFLVELQEMLKGTLAPSTINLYEQAFKTFTTIVGNRTIASVTPYHVELYKAKRMKTVSATKVNIDFRTLRAAFNRALVFGMIDKNPFVTCKNIRLPERKPLHLSKGDFDKLILVADEQTRLIVVLAVCTAMRLGELINLRWENVDIAQRTILLENRVDYVLKSRRSRVIPLNGQATGVLKRLSHLSEFVFAGKNGAKLNGRSVSRKFKECVRRAGLDERIHFHSLRHTGATWLVQANVPLPYIKEILGHSSINTTMIYSHVSPGHLRQSVERIDQLFTI